ncbi:MAG: hypothetical protein Q9M13_08600 [Mariprofundales bacterium]|nr:hypothetical protein [Mariprofundales bacterium]
MTALENIAVLPRRVNESLLALDINVSLLQVLVDYPLPGMSSALVNVTVSLYNLGLGLRLGNETPIPMERGMLLLHNLTVYVEGKEAITLPGYGVPAKEVPANESNATPAPSASGSVELIMTPPEKPANKHSFNITICYTEDSNSTPTRTCLEYLYRVELPFGWRLTIHMLDTCQVLYEFWEIVPPNETGYEIIVWDSAKPGIGEKDYCIAASAGACEQVRLEIYNSRGLIALREGRGSAAWCPMEPGTYTAIAVDEFNNTVSATFNLTWTAGPPPALKKALTSLAATIIAIIAALYIILEGRWIA